jgi:hypothetical protein
MKETPGARKASHGLGRAQLGEGPAGDNTAQTDVIGPDEAAAGRLAASKPERAMSAGRKALVAVSRLLRWVFEIW